MRQAGVKELSESESL